MLASSNMEDKGEVDVERDRALFDSKNTCSIGRLCSDVGKINGSDVECLPQGPSSWEGSLLC
jgi:hypothetical protein